jgi:hypothetical protein
MPRRHAEAFFTLQLIYATDTQAAKYAPPLMPPMPAS